MKIHQTALHEIEKIFNLIFAQVLLDDQVNSGNLYTHIKVVHAILNFKTKCVTKLLDWNITWAYIKEQFIEIKPSPNVRFVKIFGIKQFEWRVIFGK